MVAHCQIREQIGKILSFDNPPDMAAFGFFVKGSETMYFAERSRSVSDMALRLIRSLKRKVQSCLRTILSSCSGV